MRRSPLLPIFLIVLVDILGLTIILPLLPFYAESFGASPQVVGLLVASYAACQLVAGPILGKISDTTGRKPMLIVSQVGTFAGFLVLAYAHSLGLVFLARIIDGITAGNLSLAQAYISDVTPPEKRAASFGVIGIAFGIGFLLGPALSGYMSQFGYEYPILIAAGLSFTSIMATTFLLPNAAEAAKLQAAAQGAPAADAPPPPAGTRLGIFEWTAYLEYFRRPGLSRVLMQFFLFTLSFALFTSGFSLFAERSFTFEGHPFGTREVGYVFAYVGFLGIILQGGLIRPLVKRFGEEKLVLVAFFCCAASYVSLSAAHTLPLILAIATFNSIGNGLLRPSLTALVSRRVGRHEQGVVLGLTQSLQSVSQIASPIFGTWLINRASSTSATDLSAILGAASERLQHPVTAPAPIHVDHPEFLVMWTVAASVPMVIGVVTALLPSPAAPRAA